MDIITVDSNNTIYLGADIVGQIYKGPHAEEFRQRLEASHTAQDNAVRMANNLAEAGDIMTEVINALRGIADA